MIAQLRYTNNGLYFLSHSVRNKRINLPSDHNNADIKTGKGYNLKSLENLNAGFKNKAISKTTKNKIKIRCRVLNYIAEEKEVRNYEGLIIKHKCSFVTLTLPSSQIHTDIEITKLILGKFLDSCRKVGILKNYIWKAEKQKNKNIHYHILTDSYVNKTIVYRYWLLALDVLGYTKRYTEKFKNMDLKDYKRLNFNQNKSDLIINKSFWKGNKNNWRLPPCFDTKNINSVSGIENYISKYISKEDKEEDLMVNGRTWGCSNNINEGVENFKNNAEFNEFGFNVSKYILNKKSIIGDFFEIVLCKLSSFFAWYPDIANKIISSLREIITPCRFHVPKLLTLSL